MTYKEWNHVIALVGQGVVLWWLMTSGLPADLSGVAWKLLTAIGIMIVFNIVLNIVVGILAGVVGRYETVEEPTDERDRVIGARSMMAAYVVVSLGGVATLFVLAWNGNAILGAYTLFGALMLAGTTDAVARLVQYRIG